MRTDKQLKEFIRDVFYKQQDTRKKSLFGNVSEVITNSRISSTEIKDVLPVLIRIGEQYDQNIEEIEHLREEIKNFKLDAYKDQELKKMKEKLEKMQDSYYRGFPISKEEEEKIHNWLVEHENKQHGGYPCYHGASGGGYIYEFYPSGIGTAGTVICGSCQRKAWDEAKGDKKKYEKILAKYDGSFDFQEI